MFNGNSRKVKYTYLTCLACVKIELQIPMNVNMPRLSDFIIKHTLNKFTLDRIVVYAGFKDVRIYSVL